MPPTTPAARRGGMVHAYMRGLAAGEPASSCTSCAAQSVGDMATSRSSRHSMLKSRCVDSKKGADGQRSARQAGAASSLG